MSTLVIFTALFLTVVVALIIFCCLVRYVQGNKNNADRASTQNRPFTRRNEHEVDEWNRERVFNRRNNRAPHSTSHITSIPIVSRPPYPTESHEVPNRPRYPTSNTAPEPSFSRAPYPPESDETPNRTPYPTSCATSMPFPSTSSAPYPIEAYEISHRAPYPTSNRTSMPIPSITSAPYPIEPDETSNRLPYPTSNRTSMPLPSNSRQAYQTESRRITQMQDSSPLLISTAITPAPPAPTHASSNADDLPPSYSEAMRGREKYN